MLDESIDSHKPTHIQHRQREMCNAPLDIRTPPPPHPLPLPLPLPLPPHNHKKTLSPLLCCVVFCAVL